MTSCDYEKQRDENVRERQEMFANLFSDMKDAKAKLRKSVKRCHAKVSEEKAVGPRKLKSKPRKSPPRTRSSCRLRSATS